MSFGSTHEHLIVRRGKVFEASENIFRGMSVMQVTSRIETNDLEQKYYDNKLRRLDSIDHVMDSESTW